MFHYLNVQRQAARKLWEPAIIDYRPGRWTRWWGRWFACFIDGEDDALPARLRKQHATAK